MNLEGKVKHFKPYKLPQYYEKLSFSERHAVRSQYEALQSGLCYHCGGSLECDPPEKVLEKPINTKLFPASFNYKGVHLHHSHQTGLTIGAVHGYCNAVLWQYHGE